MKDVTLIWKIVVIVIGVILIVATILLGLLTEIDRDGNWYLDI